MIGIILQFPYFSFYSPLFFSYQADEELSTFMTPTQDCHHLHTMPYPPPYEHEYGYSSYPSQDWSELTSYGGMEMEEFIQQNMEYLAEDGSHHGVLAEDSSHHGVLAEDPFLPHRPTSYPEMQGKSDWLYGYSADVEDQTLQHDFCKLNCTI